MPSIEIHGLGPKPARAMRHDIVNVILTKAPKVKDDVVVSICPSEVKTVSKKNRPFIRVLSTSKKDRARVAKLINKALGIDVEWLRINGFYEGKL